jgi:hypothetical protein
MLVMFWPLMALMMEAVCTSEMSVNIYLTTLQFIPEDCKLHTRCCENLKSHLVTFLHSNGNNNLEVIKVMKVCVYLGQGIKDVVRWPRPSCPPVVRLQNKWALEYGMPSTHAMVGVSIPLSVILYTMNRYQVSLNYWLGTQGDSCTTTIFSSVVHAHLLYSASSPIPLTKYSILDNRMLS